MPASELLSPSMFQEGVKTSSVVHSSRSLLLAKRRMRLVCGNWKVVLRYHLKSQVNAKYFISLAAAGRAHTFGETWCQSSQVNATWSHTLFRTILCSEHFTCLLGTINIFKIILPSPSDYSKKKTIQIYSSAVFVLESLLWFKLSSMGLKTYIYLLNKFVSSKNYIIT